MTVASRDAIITNAQREKSIVTKREEIQAKQKAYADALVMGATKKDAALAAGYHPSSMSNVQRQEEVQLLVNEARSELRDISTIKKLDVLDIMIEAIDMARTLADPAQMINGAREVGRMMGFYEPETIKIEHNVNHNVMATKFKQMTDEELYAIASKQAKVVEGVTLEH
jgi:phage terminase small subunit